MPFCKVSIHQKSFGESLIALKEINFEVEEGSFVSIVGPSGCGKSSLLRILSGLDKQFRGEVVWKKPSQNLSFVFQEPHLIPWQSVIENIRLPSTLQKVFIDHTYEENLLQMVRLNEFVSSKPHQLSGGMKMRASLARALASQPQICFLDEPFSALDELTREDLIEDFFSIRATRPMTCFLVTHSISEAVWMSDRILVMSPRPGRIILDMKISLPWPRIKSDRWNQEFKQCCDQISSAMRKVEV